ASQPRGSASTDPADRSGTAAARTYGRPQRLDILISIFGSTVTKRKIPPILSWILHWRHSTVQCRQHVAEFRLHFVWCLHRVGDLLIEQHAKSSAHPVNGRRDGRHGQIQLPRRLVVGNVALVV